MTGPGNLDFTCGGCGKLLLQGIEEGSIRGVVFKCACGTFNEGPWL